MIPILHIPTYIVPKSVMKPFDQDKQGRYFHSAMCALRKLLYLSDVKYINYCQIKEFQFTIHNLQLIKSHIN